MNAKDKQREAALKNKKIEVCMTEVQKQAISDKAAAMGLSASSFMLITAMKEVRL